MGWKRVCSASDVAPESLARFEVDGVAVVVVNLGDELRAIPPACPHMEEALEHSGVCSEGVLTCTKHLWQWDLRTGEGYDPPDNERPLLFYELKRDGDDVLIKIDEELTYAYEDEDDLDW